MSSQVDTRWNVMKYKYHYELEHQWDLKRKFMEAHKNKYSEDRLVCLAQLFCNVHFMGCSYEENIMTLIEELSAGIAEKNPKWEKQSFVAASDAVEARVKGRLNAPQRGGQHHQGQEQNNRFGSRPGFQNFNQSSSYNDDRRRDVPYQTNFVRQQEDESCNRKRASDHDEGAFENKKMRTNFHPEQIKREIAHVTDSGPFGKVVLFQSSVIQESNVAIIERTASAAQMNVNYNFAPGNGPGDAVMCKLFFDGMFMSSASGPTQKAAKDMACKLAIERLKETSFTILVKAAFTRDGAEVNREFDSRDRNTPGSSEHKPIADDNIGNKMLKLMGWCGGGLGKNLQGIEEPIAASGSVKREGLGRNPNDFHKKIHTLLREFAVGEDKSDLVFSSEFSKDERKAIHDASRKYNLKSRSYGNDENRQLVIFKKTKPLEIVADLLACGSETPKYKLLPPNTMMDRFEV